MQSCWRCCKWRNPHLTHVIRCGHSLGISFRLGKRSIPKICSRLPRNGTLKLAVKFTGPANIQISKPFTTDSVIVHRHKKTGNALHVSKSEIIRQAKSLSPICLFTALYFWLLTTIMNRCLFPNMSTMVWYTRV